MKAYLTIGPPGSGKSTYFKKNFSNRNDIIQIERDQIRKDIRKEFSDEQNFIKSYYNRNKKAILKDERKVNSITNDLINKAKNNNFDLFFSNTNLNIKHRDRLVKHLINLGYEIHYIILYKTLDELISINNTRQKKVNKETLGKFYNQFVQQLSLFETEINNVVYYYGLNSKYYSCLADLKNDNNFTVTSNCVICDIDGTVAHMNNRNPFDWSNVYSDDIDEIVLNMVLGVSNKYDCDIVFLTGRDADAYTDTYKWLINKLMINNPEIPYIENNKVDDGRKYLLYSRNSQDMRKDSVIKTEIYNSMIVPNYDKVLCVFDDRPQMVDCWNDLGLKTIAVSDQRIEF